ncbi:putative membrane protein [Pseudomonas syringae]|uniref:Putative membrane protein n=1 Tax=Pseudomonas syringae TaxID=317 RepID=A0A2K4X280_PSESX|nr:hypothetical protein ALQ45_200236 [Pseudomonas amygdali pv. morsprunorum]RMU34925.1 hypothetical protein ALP31_00809 [Pseudomonas amygdali pv. morsprunorum]SOS42247.1 putative membrane protein [Pseudomonas syringae]SPD79833.1 putative membrane protein [Pseudomonas syringae]
MHLAQRNHRLHAVAVAVLTYNLAVITLVGKHITATLARATPASRKADLIQQRHEVARVSLLAGRQHNGQRDAMTVAGEVYFGGQSAPASAETVVLRFLRAPFFSAPLAARIDVELTIQVSRSMNPSSRKRR